MPRHRRRTVDNAYVIELSDGELEEYFDFVATGFSKGTADVTPRDVQKLKLILDHYRKSPHPFTACVRDNTKRFGPRVNAICAVVKDLGRDRSNARRVISSLIERKSVEVIRDPETGGTRLRLEWAYVAAVLRRERYLDEPEPIGNPW